jgi:hypothetical protein
MTQSGDTGGSGNIQKWAPYEMEEAEKEESELSRGSSQYLKLSEGRNVLRFMPAPAGQKSPFLLAHQHYIKMAGMENAISFNCPRAMGSKPCLVCQKAEQFRATGDKADYDFAGELLPKLRVYAGVIARAQPELGPQVFAYGKQIHEGLVKIRKDPSAGGDFTNPVDGFDIVVEKTGSGMDTKYKVMAARNNTPLGDDAWLDMMVDLRRFGRVPTEDEVSTLVQGLAFASGRGGGNRTQGRGAPAQVGRGRTAGNDLDQSDKLASSNRGPRRCRRGPRLFRSAAASVHTPGVPVQPRFWTPRGAR